MSKAIVGARGAVQVRTPDPRLARAVRQLALAGVALVLVWPAARGHSSWLGWLPLWLVGMPLSAWWALYRFPLPRWPRALARKAPVRRRRAPQARRLQRPAATLRRHAA